MFLKTNAEVLTVALSIHSLLWPHLQLFSFSCLFHSSHDRPTCRSSDTSCRLSSQATGTCYSFWLKCSPRSLSGNCSNVTLLVGTSITTLHKLQRSPNWHILPLKLHFSLKTYCHLTYSMLFICLLSCHLSFLKEHILSVFPNIFLDTKTMPETNR